MGHSTVNLSDKDTFNILNLWEEDDSKYKDTTTEFRLAATNLRVSLVKYLDLYPIYPNLVSKYVPQLPKANFTTINRSHS